MSTRLHSSKPVTSSCRNKRFMERNYPQLTSAFPQLISLFCFPGLVLPESVRFLEVPADTHPSVLYSCNKDKFERLQQITLLLRARDKPATGLLVCAAVQQKHWKTLVCRCETLADGESQLLGDGREPPSPFRECQRQKGLH